MTAFSNEATHFCDPLAFMPTRHGWQHTKWVMHRTVWKLWGSWILLVPAREAQCRNDSLLGMALIKFKVRAHAAGAKELASDLTIGNSTLKALKADCVNHGAEDDRHDRHNRHNSDDNNSDNDDLPPLSNLLHGLTRKRAMETGPLSLKRRIMTKWLLDGSGLNSGLANG